MLKRAMQFSTTILLGAAMVAGPLWGQRVANRQKNQQQRIKKGVEDGSLNKREAARLERKEAKLHREIQKDRADGPGLTPKERAKIERKQDKLSREIYREKHDNQTRKK